MRGTISVTAESADADAGSVIDSMPPEDAIGTTTSSAMTARPAARDEHARRVAVDERGRAAVEPRAAHEHAGRHLDADPSLLQHVDR